MILILSTIPRPLSGPPVSRKTPIVTTSAQAAHIWGGSSMTRSTSSVPTGSTKTINCRGWSTSRILGIISGGMVPRPYRQAST